MNTNNIIGGLLIAQVRVSLGCRQSRKLQDATSEASRVAGAVDAAGNPTGAIAVSGRLWRGSPAVMALQKQMLAIHAGFDSLTLPWGKGWRIFKAERMPEISTRTSEMFRNLDAMIEDVVVNYQAELSKALKALGTEGRLEDYPKDGQQFEDGIVRKLEVDTLGTSERLADMVGGALGKQLAAEHADRLSESIGQAQQEAADRLASVLGRFVQTCDPSKDRTRVTNSLFEDLAEVTTNIGKILIIPNPNLEHLAKVVSDRLGQINRKNLAESPELRQSVHQEANNLLSVLNQMAIV